MSQDGRSQLRLLSRPPGEGGDRWLPRPQRLAGPSSRSAEDEPLTSHPVGVPTGARMDPCLPCPWVLLGGQVPGCLPQPGRKRTSPVPPGWGVTSAGITSPGPRAPKVH